MREAQELQAARDRRKSIWIWVYAPVIFGIVVLAILMAVSLQSGSTPTSVDTVDGVNTVRAELKGIEQRGLELGSTDAPVLIQEFADLQCPACRNFASTELPGVIDDYVRTGVARLRFESWVILGEDSRTAAYSAFAAAQQDLGWNFILLMYRNQGQERSGYVTDKYLRSLAVAAGLDIERYDRDLKHSLENYDDLISRVDDAAKEQGFQGTPSILVTGPGGEFALNSPTEDSLRTAINKVKETK